MALTEVERYVGSLYVESS